jgi:hypothetical protein
MLKLSPKNMREWSRRLSREQYGTPPSGMQQRLNDPDLRLLWLPGNTAKAAMGMFTGQPVDTVTARQHLPSNWLVFFDVPVFHTRVESQYVTGRDGDGTNETLTCSKDRGVKAIHYATTRDGNGTMDCYYDLDDMRGKWEHTADILRMLGMRMEQADETGTLAPARASVEQAAAAYRSMLGNGLTLMGDEQHRIPKPLPPYDDPELPVNRQIANLVMQQVTGPERDPQEIIDCNFIAYLLSYLDTNMRTGNLMANRPDPDDSGMMILNLLP